MNDEFSRLIRAAVLAPSGDNTQPWDILYRAEAEAIEIFLDPERDPSTINAGQRMSLIACGAALENVCTLAGALGWSTMVEMQAPDRWDRRILIARVRPGVQKAPENALAVERILRERVTNRHVYQFRSLPAELRSHLEQALPAVPGLQVHWITAPDQQEMLANLIARGDASMFREPSMRQAFLHNIRFDLPPDAPADEGLSLGSLEIAYADQLALRAMRYMPDLLFRILRGAQMLGAHTRKLVRSSSGLCLVAVKEGEPYPEIQVGRVAQRAWLALTQAGLAAQPMMSLVGLHFGMTCGTAQLVESLRRLHAPKLLQDFRHFLAGIGVSGTPGFILRFGYAPPPTCRVGRRSPPPDARP